VLTVTDNVISSHSVPSHASHTLTAELNELGDTRYASTVFDELRAIRSLASRASADRVKKMYNGEGLVSAVQCCRVHGTALLQQLTVTVLHVAAPHAQTWG
jgi:hypothetical protein